MVKMELLSSRDEWLEARKNSIGGSEAAAVIGKSKWMSNVDLWEIKTGRKEPAELSDNEAVRYGTEAEKNLRALFALDFPEYEVFYDENNFWKNDRYPWAHASLDGMLVERETGRRGVLEIKTGTTRAWEEWQGGIPDGYFCQLLHYLAVTEFDFAVIKGQLKGAADRSKIHTFHYLIEQGDVEGDIEYLMQKEREFYKCVKDGKRPNLILNL